MNPQELIGLFADDAKAKCREAGVSVRVESINGDLLSVTSDLQVDRINLVLEDNIVIDVTVG